MPSVTVTINKDIVRKLLDYLEIPLAGTNQNPKEVLKATLIVLKVPKKTREELLSE